MFSNFKEHLISKDQTILHALAKLDKLAKDAILFVVDKDNGLIGSLTDGDVRRGLLKGLNTSSNIVDFIQPNPKFIRKNAVDLDQIIAFRNGNFKVIPILDEDGRILNIINFRIFKSYLPVDAVIMAGGRGERLKPLTNNTPKPMLPIGEKPIIEHNLDRLISFGIADYWISLGYLGDQLKSYFGDGESKGVTIEYVTEDQPLGTIGAVTSIFNFQHDTILVTNSDILTNLDYEDFYRSFVESGADLSVVTIPYDVNIPYAVLETNKGDVVSLKEKPTYTYFSNGGIYLMRREVIELIPVGAHFNATDLIEKIIMLGKKVHSYPLRGYWLDIGKHEDFEKAKEDISHIKF
ncbi:nucleotidyltransferase family protein [Lunatibacter salilacus]|uniref:nucleotidyltransferase family protein n=1 Tax=Lunatibacter salilacus TaxID=2483804 RepID=UPI00131B0EB6|nr:nucleotidyltransferase family protein [Lunatibacter salilacus]